MKAQPLRPHQTAILLAGVTSVALWAIPALNWLLRPLTYLNTHIHEICHALVAQTTGGEAMYIIVRSDGSGETPIMGSIIALSAMAGYVGASIVGLAIIFSSRSEEGSRRSLRVLATVLALAMLAWVRGDLVGIVSGILWVIALFGIAAKVKGPNLLFAAQFIGIMQCLNSANSLFSLLQISAVTETHSDATLMQQVTGIPALVWAGMWCAFSGGLLLAGLRRAWSDPIRRARQKTRV